MRRETLVSGRVFAVERRWYPRDDGGTLMREIVVHPGAVTVLPLLADGSVVMIYNFRHAVEEELLELPAGTLESGEAAAACAARELEEETGYAAGRIEPLCEFFTTSGITNERMLVFVATELTKTSQKLQGDEQIRVEIMDPARLQDMLVGGRIRDGKTIAVLSTFFMRNRA